MSFGLKTNESSDAALGDAIRAYPGYIPTLLRETPSRIGAAVATFGASAKPGLVGTGLLEVEAFALMPGAA